MTINQFTPFFIYVKFIHSLFFETDLRCNEAAVPVIRAIGNSPNPHAKILPIHFFRAKLNSQNERATFLVGVVGKRGIVSEKKI